MSLTARVLLGLVAGLALGISISGTESAALMRVARAIEPLGTLWVNAIRMTVVPLIAASLIAGIGAARDTSSVARVGGRAILFFLAVLGAAAVFSLLVAPLALGMLDLDAAVAAGLRNVAREPFESATAQLPGFRQWLIALVPPNPVRAAVDGLILPVIVFSVALGLAVATLSPRVSSPIVLFLQGIASAMLVIVKWVLAAAPIGVFALAVPLAAQLGVAAAGAVVFYIVLVSSMCAAFMLLLYPLAVALGRVPLRRFATATAPAQAVAFSSRSSLAALPAMIVGAERTLGLPPAVTTFFLPLSASMFRIGGVIGQVVGVLFLARLFGGTLDAQLYVTVAVTSILTSFSVPGIPGGSILVMVPVLIAAGLPVGGVGILLAVDTIPDMFRTTVNVTGHMAAATVLARGAEGMVPSVESAGVAGPPSVTVPAPAGVSPSAPASPTA